MENTSDYIIETIAPIFNKQGFVGTSLSDLTKATNLTKGALYCNFENKEELALKAFQYNVKKALSPLFAAIQKESTSVDKLYAMTKYYRSYYEFAKERGGCPILNVGTDAKHNNVALYEEARKHSNKLIAGLSSILQHGIDSNELVKTVNPEASAMNIYSMIEGAVFMASIQENPVFLDNILDHIDSEIIEKIRT